LHSGDGSATVEPVHLRAVIVDDSKPFLVSASSLLESQGVEVVGTATSSAEALELSETLGPDLALVDVELGKEDGFALAKAMGSRFPKTRVILISTYSVDEIRDLLDMSPVVGFISKKSLSGVAIRDLLALERD
jgi:two-component system nitrate/nitrite response regulator NarL